MFGPITIPFGAKLLFNTVKLKPGVTYDDVELALAEMCHVVKETYGGDKGGFIAGQVFRFSGFVSEEGSLGEQQGADHDLVIATYWRSFDEHERSHADAVFREKWGAGRDVRRDSRTRLRIDVAGCAGDLRSACAGQRIAALSPCASQAAPVRAYDRHRAAAAASPSSAILKCAARARP